MKITASMKQKTFLVLLGIVISFFIMETGLRFAGKKILYLQEKENIINIEGENNYKILCLGESTTALPWQCSYPKGLEKILNNKIDKVSFKVINKGLPGLTSDIILAQLKDNLKKYNPDIVITMIGINDERFNLKVDSEFNLWLRILLNKSYSFHLISLIVDAVYGVIKSRSYNFQGDYLVNRAISIKKEDINIKKATYYLERAENYYERNEYDKVEKYCVKALWLNPFYADAYLCLIRMYGKIADIATAERWFNVATRIDPNCVATYIELSQWYLEHSFYLQGDTFEKVEKLLSRAIRLDRSNGDIYELFGIYYSLQQQHKFAKKFFKKAIELDPCKGELYAKLGRCYAAETNYVKAEELFLKALELDPDNPVSYSMAIMYVDHLQEKSERAEKYFKDAINYNNNPLAYIDLGYFYKKRDMREKERLLVKEMERKIKNNKDYFWIKRVLGYLASYYLEKGDKKRSDKYFKRIKKLRTVYFSHNVKYNYNKIRQILQKKNIPLVAVQYPVRNIEPLKRLLGYDSDVFFISNEKVFKDALEEKRYEDIFTDAFAGDFGHCTCLGNQLLAENIANIIMDKFFNN